MHVSFNSAIDGPFVQTRLGEIHAASSWRAADKPVAEIDRDIALRALVREAEEVGADGLVEVQFAVEEVAATDIDGVKLRRVNASGAAVRLAAKAAA
jgi:hypothetical protein